MPDPVRLVVVTAVFIETFVARIGSTVRRGTAARRIVGAARGRVGRILDEAQEMLVPIREDAPMTGHALHRPSLVMLDQIRMSFTAPEAAERSSTIASSPRSIRGFHALDSQAMGPSAPNPPMDRERGHS